jgi:DNA-binding GntR family transcriptional regulator
MNRAKPKPIKSRPVAPRGKVPPAAVPIRAASPELGSAPAQNLAQRAYRQLRDAIEEGTIEPGRRLLEIQLSAWLQISRTPVREALRRLQTEGLLEHGPGGGLTVAVHDAAAVTELYAVRESLEGAAAAMAARNADATEIQMLAALVRVQGELPPDVRVHARENKLFHECIYRAAHNRFLLKSLQALGDAMALLGRTNFAVPGRIASSIEEHRAIAEAIAAREPGRAEEAARRHIRHGYASRLQAMTADLHAAAVDRARIGAIVPLQPAHRKQR